MPPEKYNISRRFEQLEYDFDKTVNFLKKIRWMDNEIDALIEDKKSYMDIATKTTSTLDSNRVQSSSGCNDKMAEITSKIADIENDIYARIDRLIDYKKTASNVIRQIGDKECQMVLVLKFIRYMQMTDIAEKMNMDRTTVYRKYKKGIELAQEILSDSDKK
jgi:predicted DNA-binding transcriptional regulator AlpA|nr:MAG TPA: Protein of unknown function (DUF1492) [Caudoviricetes sp.]